MLPASNATQPPQAAPPRVVLVTGFDPFDGAASNPSWDAARALHGREILGHRVLAACLPTRFDASLPTLKGLLLQHRPAMAVCLGLASSRSAISLERVAINVDDARIPDNAGAQPVDAAIRGDGPAAYFTRLPIKAMLRALQQAGIAAEVSQTAGTFVCNHVFYGLMDLLATQPELATVRGGFIHVPPVAAGQTGPNAVAAMPLPVLVEGLALALHTALQHPQDVSWGAGQVD